MWIILTTKLPTEVSPPRMSIHWAGASAADVTRMQEQMVRSTTEWDAAMMSKADFQKRADMRLTDMGDKYFDNATRFGYEPKEDGAVWIVFDSAPVKVWPHEYNPVSPDILELYLLGESSDEYTMSHAPMYGRLPLFVDPMTLDGPMQFEKYPRYNRTLAEAAMVDGQNEVQAFYTSLGVLPLDLWFAPLKNYADLFGFSDYELTSWYKDEDIHEQIKSGWQEPAV